MITKNITKFNEEMFADVVEQVKLLNGDNTYSSLSNNSFFENEIVKDFNIFNFFGIDCHTGYLNHGSEQNFINFYYKKVENVYLKNHKKMTKKEILNFKESSDYIWLVNAITYRLHKFYRSFLTEDYKIYCTFKQAKLYNIPIRILESKSIDNIIGVDYILVIDKQLVLYIHSITGSQSSFDYLNKKMDKTVYLNKMESNNQVMVDRKQLYTPKNHKVLVDYYSRQQAPKLRDMGRYYARQIDNLLSDYFFLDEANAKKSFAELSEVVNLISKLEEDETVNIMIYDGE